MFSRLDLAASQCREICITTHLKLSLALAEKIVGESHGHKRGGVPYSALYGTVYTINKVPHVVRAYMRRIQEGYYHVEFRYLTEKWPKPPKSVKSAEKLAMLLNEEAQECLLECDARFIYEQKNGWNSVIEIPIAVPQKEGGQRFTHIEAIRLSKREQDDIQYSVEIQRTRSGDVSHWVKFRELSKGSIEKEAPQRILERCSGLSKSLVRQEEEKHGS